MGLFDTIIVEDGMDLPGFEEEERPERWQSKDVERPAMQTYRITTEGRLERREVEREEAGTRRLPGTDEGGDGFELPEYEVVDEWWADHNQHGSFQFYTTVGDRRYRYEARFTRGDLDGIVLIEKRDT